MYPQFPQGAIPPPIPTAEPDAAPAAHPTVPIAAALPDYVLAPAAFLLGYLFLWLVYPFHAGFGVTLFAVCFFGVSVAYLHVCKMAVVTKKNAPWLALSLLSALNFSLFSNYELSFFNLLFLMVCSVYWISCAAGTRLEPRLGNYFMADLSNHFFRIPFLNFACEGVLAKRLLSSRKNGRILAAAAGLVMAIPFVLVAVPMLMEADGTFDAMIRSAGSNLDVDLFTIFWRLILTVPVSCYLCGLLYGAARRRRVDTLTAETVDKRRSARHVLPAAMTVTGLGTLCCVYFLFFLAQAVSLYQAFFHPVESGFSYSEYARRGFFELCVVAFLNFSAVMLAVLFTARTDGRPAFSVRLACAFLSGSTLLLILTAFSKMALYISRFGLTRKRVYTSWFMLLLFLIFCLLLAAQFRRFAFVRPAAAIFAACFLILCYANVDGLIVSCNTSRYLAGTLPDMDVDSFYSMPYAAAPQARKLLNGTTDSGLRCDLLQFLEWGGYHESQVSFQSANLQQKAAESCWLKEGS